MSVRRTFFVWLIASLVVLGIGVGASATTQRRTPPTVALIYKGEVVQRVRPYTFCWSYQYKDGATGMCADGWPEYPEAAQVDAGSRLKLRIRYPGKPQHWFLQAHRVVVDNNGRHETVGPTEELDFTVKPHRVDGVIRAWDLVFRVDEPLRHYYLDTGGDLDQGDAFYALHVQT